MSQLRHSSRLSLRTCNPRSAIRNPQCRRAFTLLELILVLVVISVVLAMAAPSLRGFFAGRQAADSATAMLSLTKLAQSQAIAQGRPYRLNIDTQGGRFFITAQEAGSYCQVATDMGREFRIPTGCELTVETTSSQLAPSGLPSAANQPAPTDLGGRLSVAMGGSPAVESGVTDDGCDYIQFYPTGRHDVARVEIRDSRGDAYVVSCESATEPFRITTPGEAE